MRTIPLSHPYSLDTSQVDLDGRELTTALDPLLLTLSSTSTIVLTSSTMATYVSDNPRRVKARRETSSYTISKYEHLEELHGLFEVAGQQPMEPLRSLPAPGETNGEANPGENAANNGEGRVAPTPRIWRTRRRRDAKVCRNLEKLATQCAMPKTQMNYRSFSRTNSWTTEM